MENSETFKAGFVGLIGLPNAGKSSLMNTLVGEKVAIVNKKPQTTRQRVVGILNHEQMQAAFVDAPGYVQAEKGLNAFLQKEFEDVIKSSDVVCLILAADENRSEEIKKIIQLGSRASKPWLAIVTKVDLGSFSHRIPLIKDWVFEAGGKALTFSSIRPDKEELASLLVELYELLPENPGPLFDPDYYTPHNLRELASEIVREKCFEHLHQEIPYALGVRIVAFEESEKIIRIFADILVEKENYKSMVIGKQGQLIKKIGTDAREDIEKLVGSKVYLELKVVVRERWSENPMIMDELGYSHKKGRS